MTGYYEFTKVGVFLPACRNYNTKAPPCEGKTRNFYILSVMEKNAAAPAAHFRCIPSGAEPIVPVRTKFRGKACECYASA